MVLVKKLMHVLGSRCKTPKCDDVIAPLGLKSNYHQVERWTTTRVGNSLREILRRNRSQDGLPCSVSAETTLEGGAEGVVQLSGQCVNGPLE